MIPGYMSVLLMLIVFILWVTGWKQLLAPSVRTGPAIILTATIAFMLAVPISMWISPLKSFPGFRIHAAACLLLVVSAVIVWRTAQEGQRAYLVLCALMLAIVWGSAHSLYSHEAMFYWIDPSWDAPLLVGVLCGAFSSNDTHQIGIVAWGAAIGECVEAVLRSGGFEASIGSWAWWDGFVIALCTAAAVTILVRAVRVIAGKLGEAWMQMRGGRSS